MNPLLDRYRKLFAYDAWANARQLEVLRGATCEPALRGLSHVLAAQYNWLGRIQKHRGQAEARTCELFPLFAIEEAANRAAELQGAWAALFDELKPGELEHEVAYVSLAGAPGSNLLCDILEQVSTHGVHHRAQGQSALRAAGIAVVEIGYITYLRQLGK